jgi:hypothetical protein
MTSRFLRRNVGAVIIAAGLLSGCAGPTVVVMKNPANGEIVQCNGANTGLSVVAENWAARDCAVGYQAAGWTRMN